jgi:integrase
VLIATGVKDVASLADLTEPQNVEALLRRVWDQNGGETSPGIGVLAGTISAVARRYVRRSDADMRRLKQLEANLRPRQNGFSPRVAKRIRQFEIEDNLRRLLFLPARVMQKVRASGSIDRGTALLVMRALAVELLTVAPMRLRNLVGLEIDRHIRREGRGRHQRVFVVIPGEETKTGAPLTMPLPESTARILDLYASKYRPHLEGGSGPYLFPGRGEARRDDSAFSQALSAFIHRQTGLEMHVHLFRQVAALLYLWRHPDDIETVRRFLGHASTKTTLKAYAQIASDGAFRRLDMLIDEHRRALPSGSHGASR